MFQPELEVYLARVVLVCMGAGVDIIRAQITAMHFHPWRAQLAVAVPGPGTATVV